MSHSSSNSFITYERICWWIISQTGKKSYDVIIRKIVHESFCIYESYFNLGSKRTWYRIRFHWLQFNLSKLIPHWWPPSRIPWTTWFAKNRSKCSRCQKANDWYNSNQKRTNGLFRFTRDFGQFGLGQKTSRDKIGTTVVQACSIFGQVLWSGSIKLVFSGEINV